MTGSEVGFFVGGLLAGGFIVDGTVNTAWGRESGLRLLLSVAGVALAIFLSGSESMSYGVALFAGSLLGFCAWGTVSVATIPSRGNG